MNYTKPPLSIDKQIDLLVSRGMTIPDRSRASRYLSHISYYRLRGYWIPLEQEDDGPNHAFQPGTTFDNALDLYIFDRKFRLLVLEAIERFEVSIRANFANQLGLRYGSHFFLEDQYFHNADVHRQLLQTLSEEIGRSRETFIEHYGRKYNQPPMPPIWAVCEVMSFGQLSMWFKNIKTRQDRNLITSAYGIDEVFLRSFMHHLTHVRNITAHHGRLWNRRFTITMAMPKQPPELTAMLNPNAPRYVGNTVIVMGYFLKLISPGTTWPERMRQLMSDSPNINPHAMGFEKKWSELPIWGK